MNANQAEMAKTLRQAGYRLTQPRLAVLQVLQQTGEGLSPEEVLRQGRAICESLGLATVYRTLDLLTRMGFARRIHTQDGCRGYAAANLGHRHHLICRQCGAALEFAGCDLSPLLARVSSETGYVVEDHLLELVGVCPGCR